uniref:AAA+ ATPase domain-containing protein n=1 Tax=viral metagenome TaxID=1070528 RepID=A0A6C0IHA5_9ZZZZ
MSSLVGQESIWAECIKQFETPSHIFITGAPGCGKTTLMRELLQTYAKKKKRPTPHLWGVDSIDECLLLGPDQDRGIQTIRGQVSLFIRQMGVGEDIFRWVIIDDVDTFPQISQQALRRPMESYSHITRFLFIGTSEEDLIPALRSRCIHIAMNPIDSILHMKHFLHHVAMPTPDKFTEDMWSWVINIAGNNISDLVRLLKLIRDIHVTLKEELSLKRVRILCSAPFYVDFIPLLTAMSANDSTAAIKSLLLIWKRGYAYEDILESFQVINTLFGNNNFKDNIQIHKFLIHSWISYCKGNTSILALQNVIYKTIT